MLEPVLRTAGREGDMRIHASTLTRARETADIIAAMLPMSVQRVPPRPTSLGRVSAGA